MIQILFLWCVAFGISLYAEAQEQWSPRHDWRGLDQSRVTGRAPTVEYSIGAFKILWDQSATQLTVESPTSKILWQTLPAQAFVLAGQGRETVWQGRGSFILKDQADGVKCREQSVDALTKDQAAVTVLGRLQGPNCDVAYALSFTQASPSRLQFKLEFFEIDRITKAQKINRSYLVYASSPDEHFYGFGEQFSSLDLKGRNVPILATEQGHLRGLQPFSALLNTVAKGTAGAWYTTYTAIPFYLTNKNRGLFLENSEYSLFNLTRPEAVEIAVWNRDLTGQILSGESPLQIIEAFTEYSGRMKALPKWFHKGAIVGLMGGSAVVRKMWAQLKAHDTPIAAFWLQDWQGVRQTLIGTRLWWNWQLDRSLYPDWEQLVADFKQSEIATLGYINPFLSDTTSRGGQARNFYAEAKAKGYLVQKANGAPYEIDSSGISGTLIDLTNPDAFRWYKSIIKDQLIGIGLKGWMADFGEGLPFDAKIAMGKASEVHNRYPELWAEANQQAIEELGQSDEIIPFYRSASTRSPAKASLFWLGDQMTTWDEYDGMKSAIMGLLSGGISGLSLNHADMGGYVSIRQKIAGYPLLNFFRSKELLLRGMEMSAFTSIFRNHEGVNPSLNHQFYSDESTLDFYAYFAKIYAALVDYRQELFVAAETKGYPVARYLFLEFPTDPIAWDIKDQWMLGPDFMIAPVTDSGARSKTLYLPKGHWVHLWTGSEWTSSGEWIAVSAPLGQPPVFYRQGSSAGENLRAKVVELPFKPTAEALETSPDVPMLPIEISTEKDRLF